VVTNSAGSVTSASVRLTINPRPIAPEITGPPTGQTVTEGESATFSVTATGTSPLSYQWRRDGANLPGETKATLDLSAVRANLAGSYTVVVTNQAGSVISVPGRLTVNLRLTAYEQEMQLEGGQLTNITLTGIGPPGVNLSYEVVTKPILGVVGVPNGAILSYKANEDASGRDSFKFKVGHGAKWSEPATVSVTITESRSLAAKRKELDSSLSQLETYHRQWIGDISEEAAKYIATQAVALEREYSNRKWLDTDRQGRFRKIKSDNRLGRAFKEASK